MSWKHSRQQFPFARDDKLLIVQRIVATFGHQGRDVVFLEEEFIEPGDLRQNLQIGEILCLEISFRALGMISMLAKSLPQLAVPRITPDHILRICLEQVLERKPPLLDGKIFRRFCGNANPGDETAPTLVSHTSGKIG